MYKRRFNWFMLGETLVQKCWSIDKFNISGLISKANSALFLGDPEGKVTFKGEGKKPKINFGSGRDTL